MSLMLQTHCPTDAAHKTASDEDHLPPLHTTQSSSYNPCCTLHAALGRRLGVALAGGDGGTLEATRAAGGDETDLLAGRRVAAHRRCVPNVLVVSTTVRVLHRVHGHAPHLVHEA